tara:strand:+ start:26 stop:661 length:636 start_codon:yes stop_codon:yes gene_type:complete
MVSRKLNRRINKRNTRQKKGKKQTSKVIKCKRCNKQIKITKRNYKKIKDAGNLKYICNNLCCGVNSDAMEPEPSTIKPINENNLKPFIFNSKGDYEALPTWQADYREKMKKLMNSNKMGEWSIAPPVVELINRVPTYRVTEGRDEMYDPETISLYNRDEIKELPIAKNLGEMVDIDKDVKKVKASKKKTAKKKKRLIPTLIPTKFFRFNVN